MLRVDIGYQVRFKAAEPWYAPLVVEVEYSSGSLLRTLSFTTLVTMITTYNFIRVISVEMYTTSIFRFLVSII